MTISEEGKKALAEWKKIRDYTIPSVTLSFSEETIGQAYEIVVAEDMPMGFGAMLGNSIEVPAALVCVFSHLSPQMVDNKAASQTKRGRRRLLTPEESSKLMEQQGKEWQKK